MVKKGKHHTQAVCACATHLLDRVLVVLRDGKADEWRDVDGMVVTKQPARPIIAARCTVPAEVRRQRRVGQRRERGDRTAERRQAKERVLSAYAIRAPDTRFASTGGIPY